MRSKAAGSSPRSRSRKRAAAGRSGAEARRSSMRSSARMSGQLVQDLDGVAGADGSGGEDGGVEAAHAPTGRSRVEGFDLAVVDFVLDGGAVEIGRAHV